MKFLIILPLLCQSDAFSQSAASVSGSVTLLRASVAKGANGVDSSGAVIWLKPVGQAAPPAAKRYEIRQHHKRFDPHILAVGVGSLVAFPNLDPVLHNVFSVVDGKRFDLGLYESGASRSVSFDRPGICYIFCNIHPDMSAVVIVLDTPYFALTDAAGNFLLRDLPAGRYTVNVWHERARPENPREFPHEVSLASLHVELPRIRLIDSGQLAVPHKNKYGREYDLPHDSIYH